MNKIESVHFDTLICDTNSGGEIGVDEKKRENLTLLNVCGMSF